MTRTTSRPSLLRAGAAAGLGVLLLLPATAADAHVRVSADQTTPGAFSALTFRVPNESDTAGTVAVSVELPQDTPFLYVSTRPVPGWRAATKEAALPKPVEAEGTTLTKAVRTVTWTAERGTRIEPGEYQEFSISVGPLPAAGTVLLPGDPDLLRRRGGPLGRAHAGGRRGARAPRAGAGRRGRGRVRPARRRRPRRAARPRRAPRRSRPDGVARALGGAGLALGLAALVGRRARSAAPAERHVGVTVRPARRRPPRRTSAARRWPGRRSPSWWAPARRPRTTPSWAAARPPAPRWAPRPARSSSPSTSRRSRWGRRSSSPARPGRCRPAPRGSWTTR